MGKGVYITLIICAVIIFITAFASMVMASVAAKNVTSDSDKAKQYANWTAIANGVIVGFVILLFILVIVWHKDTIATAAKQAADYSKQKIGQAGQYMQGYGGVPIVDVA